MKYRIEGASMEFSRNLYVQRLLERRKNGLIKIITGTRRAGKSYPIFDS